MPSGSVVVVIAGFTDAALIVMLRFLVASPATLTAFTVMLAVPAVVGVPLIVFPLRLRPAGRVPEDTLHVIGVVPVALRVAL